MSSVSIPNLARKRRAKKKKQVSSNATSTPPNTTPQPTTNVTTTPTPTPTTQKMHQLLDRLKARRTGVEHRQKVKVDQTRDKAKPKNAMRNMARAGIHDLLGKMNIDDPKFESEIMNELVRGKIFNPADMTNYLVQKLEQRFPRGPTRNTSTTESKTPSGSLPPPPLLSSPDGLENVKNGPKDVEHCSLQQTKDVTRKPLRHPTSSLLANPRSEK